MRAASLSSCIETAEEMLAEGCFGEMAEPGWRGGDGDGEDEGEGSIFSTVLFGAVRMMIIPLIINHGRNGRVSVNGRVQ